MPTSVLITMRVPKSASADAGRLTQSAIYTVFIAVGISMVGGLRKTEFRHVELRRVPSAPGRTLALVAGFGLGFVLLVHCKPHHVAQL
jgi:hypothetical protein